MEEELLQSNASGNGTNCYGDYCVQSTLYRKVMGTAIFVLVWPFIVLDIKRFPLGRPAAALVGAVLMVVFVVVPQDQVYVILGDRGNLQTLFLLIGMMLLSYYFDREGVLQHITLWIFGKDRPFKHVLWKVCVLSAVLSAIITNDATCLVLTPLLLAEHIKQNRPRTEYPPLLLGIATSSNIGSASTFFGNPQNAFIAANSRGQVSLLIFFVTTLPAAMLGLSISIALLYLCYYRTLWPMRSRGGGGSLLATEMNGKSNGVHVSNGRVNDPSATTCNNTTGSPDEPLKRNGVYLSMAASREELALSYEQSSTAHLSSGSLLPEERRKFHTKTEVPAAPSSSSSSWRSSRQRVRVGETSYSAGGSGGSSTGSSSQQEYGAVAAYNYNHLHNHVMSGRASRQRTPSSADRFDRSSLKISHLQQEGARLEDMSLSSPPGAAAAAAAAAATADEAQYGGLAAAKSTSTPTLTTTTTSTPSTTTRTTPTATTWRRRAFVCWLFLITSLLVVLLAIPPPPAVSVEFNLGLVPVAAGVTTMLVDTLLNRRYAFEAIMKVDWSMILMFMGLFIWLSGFENTLFPSDAFESMRPYMDLYTVQGVLLFTLAVVVGSNILSNVPLVILIMDQLFNFECGGRQGGYCSGQLSGMLLVWVSTIAGNFTLIGSVANLIVAEKGRYITNYRLGFWEYIKFGFCSTVLVLFAGLPIVYFAGGNVSI